MGCFYYYCVSLFSLGHPIWAVIIAIFGGVGVLTYTVLDSYDYFYEAFSKKMAEHTGVIAGDLANKYFGDALYFWYGLEGFIYNNECCAYFSADTGELVIYNKSNIKEVSRERVHVGSSTSGYATTNGISKNTLTNTLGVDPFKSREITSTTTVNTQTKEHYEWHFDVLTDYLPHPKISLVLPGDKASEDEIGKAYGVLKP